MARIAGVNIPAQKRVEIALTYIYGIGHTKAKKICEKVGIPAERRVSQMTDDEVMRVREAIDRDIIVEGDLRREVAVVLGEIGGPSALRELTRLVASPSPDSPDKQSPEHGCTSIAESIRRIKTVRDELQQIVQML